MTLIANTLCTEAEVVRRFSQIGVTEHADLENAGTATTGVVDDCINQATEEIRGFAWRWYSDATLATSTLVNRWATNLAVYFLCTVRGLSPPEAVAAEFERIMALLEKVAAGHYRIPGLALRGDLRPTMSNVQIDRRYPYSTVRVTRANSSDPPTALTQDEAEIPVAYE